LWSVDNHDTAARGGFNVNIVKADSGATDHDELISELEGFSRHLGC
jgi:hypothetical protein